MWNKIVETFTDFYQAVHEINQKYKEPRIKVTPMVSAALLMLRLYLIGMVLILAYKFITLVVH